MRTRFLLAVGVCVLAVTLGADASSYLAFEQVTVAGTAIGFTATKITASGLPMATFASCRLETAEVRYTVDGSVPTSTVGTPLEPGDVLELTGHDVLSAFRAIRTGATSGQLDCHYTAP